MQYRTSDVHLRYDRGRAVSPAGIGRLLATIRQHVRSPARLAIDLGCGTGRFTSALAEIATTTLGIDVAPNMLGMARQKQSTGPRILFSQASAESLPLADRSVDLVLLSQVFHHLDAPRSVFGEIARVLCSGGVLAVRQTTRENLGGFLYQRFFPEARAIDEGRLPPCDAITQLATDAGLVIQSFHTVSSVVARTAEEYVERIGLRTHSDLQLISDRAFARGMAALRRSLAGGGDQSFEESNDLFLFARRTDDGEDKTGTWTKTVDENRDAASF